MKSVGGDWSNRFTEEEEDKNKWDRVGCNGSYQGGERVPGLGTRVTRG